MEQHARGGTPIQGPCAPPPPPPPSFHPHPLLSFKHISMRFSPPLRGRLGRFGQGRWRGEKERGEGERKRERQTDRERGGGTGRKGERERGREGGRETEREREGERCNATCKIIRFNGDLNVQCVSRTYSLAPPCARRPTEHGPRPHTGRGKAEEGEHVPPRTLKVSGCSLATRTGVGLARAPPRCRVGLEGATGRS